MDAALAARVAWTTACTMYLTSTLGVDDVGGSGVTWGAGTVGKGAAKAGREEVTGDV